MFRVASPLGRMGMFRVYAAGGWRITGTGPLHDGCSVETF